MSKVTGGLNLPLDFKCLLMDNEIPEINELIQQFSKLPGLGPKSAKRIILKLINNKDGMVKPLAKSLAQVYKR